MIRERKERYIQKKTIKWILLIVFISFVLYKGCSVKSVSDYSNNGEWIVVSVTNANNKSELWRIDTENKTKQKLVDNRDVIVTGKVDNTGNILLYSDAIGNEPWDIYKLNIQTKEIHQITDDLSGQFNLKFGDKDGNIILSKSGGKNSPVPQLLIVDTNKESGKIIDIGLGLGVQDFDVCDNKIIVLAFSYEEFITKKFKEKNELAKINYYILEMDLDGKNKKTIYKTEATRADSISFTKSKDCIIIGGEGLIGNEKGFYKLELGGNTIESLLTEDDIIKTNLISEVSQPFIAVNGYDNKNIYFTAVALGTKEKEIAGLTVKPNMLYCYNLETKKIEEVFGIPNTFISSISYTYK